MSSLPELYTLAAVQVALKYIDVCLWSVFVADIVWSVSVHVCVLLQTWNQHFFVLTSSHLYYTEEQQQDATDGDDTAADDDVVSC